jgi:hypothetical protein
VVSLFEVAGAGKHQQVGDGAQHVIGWCVRGGNCIRDEPCIREEQSKNGGCTTRDRDGAETDREAGRESAIEKEREREQERERENTREGK